jgi:imidazolonepropionase-like amidohydrolase
MFDAPGGDPASVTVVGPVGVTRDAVRRRIADGAKVIKVSPRVDPSLMAFIVSAARARGVPVAAHLGATTAIQAADVGVTSIEHLSGIAEAASADGSRLTRAHAASFFGGWTAAQLEWAKIPLERLEAVARELVGKGVVMVPTLVAHQAVSRLADADIVRDPALVDVPAGVLAAAWKPSQVMARAQWTPEVLARFKQAFPVLQQFVGIYVREGGRVAAGSDVGQAFVVPGAGLHRELELLVACGLSPAQALRSATADAAVLLGVSDRVGTIDAGKSADFVLLGGDPLADIGNARRILAVVKDGAVVVTADPRGGAAGPLAATASPPPTGEARRTARQESASGRRRPSLAELRIPPATPIRGACPPAGR